MVDYTNRMLASVFLENIYLLWLNLVSRNIIFFSTLLGYFFWGWLTILIECWPLFFYKTYIYYG